MRLRFLLLAILGVGLAGCAETVPLVQHAHVGTVRPLPVAMEPRLRQLEDRTREGVRTLVVPTGQLLAYHFPGVSPGSQPRATLYLIDSRLEFINTGTRSTGPLGLLSGLLYLSVVEGYKALYTLNIEAITPDGARHLIAARGQGQARMDGQAAIVAAVVQAVGSVREQVEDLPPPPAASPLPFAGRSTPYKRGASRRTRTTSSAARWST